MACENQQTEKCSNDQTIGVTSLAADSGVPSPKLWTSSSWARDWFEDALSAAKEAGRHARRRETLFAVCCAESYLFEWVRDEVLKGKYDELAKYFPPGNH
jgi:hypothetical protein